jgi:ferredoxin
MSDIYYASTERLAEFFSQLKDSHKVFSPIVKNTSSPKALYCYKGQSQETPLIDNAYRTLEPLKSFFTHNYEKVADYFAPEKEATEIRKKAVIFGVKACDIAGHKIQDFVFLEGVEADELYRLRRENTILVSSDCTDYLDVCHCLAWEILPHPVSGFDLNLSKLNDGYLIEVGSTKGSELLSRSENLFVRAKESQISARQAKRENLITRLKAHIEPQNLVPKGIVQRLMKDGFALDTWKEFMLPCVECGGCNLICDTCHCFLLADRKSDGINAKVRIWDSCLYANYARVAGGANPLKLRAQRLRNRFLKKFDFFVDNLGMPACCGCGRCIEVCPGKIDIREVLKDLAKRLSIGA